MKKIPFIPLACLVPFLSCEMDPSFLLQEGGAPVIIDLDDTDPLALDGDESTGILGQPDLGAGERGGATATFQGTGDTVCLVLDPEDEWDRDTGDDGDADLHAGLTADYTGVFGETMGSFEQEWVDELGVTHTVDLNICIQYDRSGNPGAHAGRGTPEWCEFETVEGVSYTVVVETFSVPLDDNELLFSLGLFSGPCGTVTENTLDEDN